MELLTLFGRREPTTDPVARAYGLSNLSDVVLYKDPQCTRPVARYHCDHSKKPTRRNKYVMHNCFRYRLQWS